MDKTTFLGTIKTMVEKAKKEGKYRTFDAERLKAMMERIKAKKEGKV